MEIRAGNAYPFGAISNLIKYKFVFRGIECNSMEGLLQSFKMNNKHGVQEFMCKLSGVPAKYSGGDLEWWRTQTLWWDETPIDRHSDEYQDMLDEAYECLFRQNKKARKALLDTKNAKLKHSMGNSDPTHTILTRQEFCSRLTRIRSDLQAENFLEFE